MGRILEGPDRSVVFFKVVGAPEDYGETQKDDYNAEVAERWRKKQFDRENIVKEQDRDYRNKQVNGWYIESLHNISY